RPSTKGPDQPGTVDADVSKSIEVRDRNIQCLAAAHRQSRDGSVSAVRVNAVVALRIGHDVGHKIVDKFISRSRSAATPSTKRPGGMSCRHDDHHRPGFLCRDQVVENESGAAYGCPSFIAVAGAVQ